MDEIEQSELKRTELELLTIYGRDHQFKIEDICNIHELWLGDVYPMAGKYRTVMMEKDGFPFAAPQQIEKLMNVDEKYLDEIARETGFIVRKRKIDPKKFLEKIILLRLAFSNGSFEDLAEDV